MITYEDKDLDVISAQLSAIHSQVYGRTEVSIQQVEHYVHLKYEILERIREIRASIARCQNPSHG